MWLRHHSSQTLYVARVKIFFLVVCSSPWPRKEFDWNGDVATLVDMRTTKVKSINQFSGPAYPWGVAGAAAQVGASKHLDPLQQRIDALLGCQGETN